MEGDKLVQVQKWDGKETKFVREIKDGKMVMVRCDPPLQGQVKRIFLCVVVVPFISLWSHLFLRKAL